MPVADDIVEAEVLPPIDRFLFLLEQWLPSWLASIEDPQHRRLIERFATWHVLRQLRNASTKQLPVPSLDLQPSLPTTPRHQHAHFYQGSVATSTRTQETLRGSKFANR